MIEVAIALGANLGDPIGQLRAAVRALVTMVTGMTISHVYRSEPIGLRDQPDFYNLVLVGRTEHTIYDLHQRAVQIEEELGRQRVVPNGPRTIDIDLLSYGALVLSSPTLTLPHPRMQARSFVLAPLAEIAPEWRHPINDQSASDSLAQLTDRTPLRCWGSLDP